MSAGSFPGYFRPVWSGAFFCIAMLVLLAGCGRSTVAPAGNRGETVLRQDTQRIRGFDPVRAGDVASALAISRIYEPLLQYSYLDRPYRLEPLLAAEMPTVSDDGRIWTFRVREGIYFQDDPCFTATGGKGREVVAEDFVYAIKRLVDQKNQPAGYWTIRGRLLGMDAFRDHSGESVPTDYEADVPGLQALDRYTLQITLVKPYPQLLWVMAMHYTAAVPREAVEFYGRDFSRNPVGSGPYILREWTPNYRLDYVRNPKWQETGRMERYPSHGTPEDEAAGLLTDAGKPLPFVDRIVDYVVLDPATRWLMFMTGQLDASDVSRDNWDAVLDSQRRLNPDLAARGLAMASGPTLRLGYFAFNMEDPLLGNNLPLRQAMTCAFDTEAWIALYNGRITRPTGPIPEGLAGYDPALNPYPFDLVRAQRLMTEAGYPEGRDPATGRRLRITLELGRADDAELRQSAELFAFFMSRIGIQIDISYNNAPAFFEKLERRQAPMFFLSWIGDYPDAQNFLQLFYGPNASPGSNRCNYRNPAFDALYERIKVMEDSDERTRIYQQMATMIAADCPWIFAYQYVNVGLRHASYHNYKMHAFPNGMEKYYRIIGAQKGL